MADPSPTYHIDIWHEPDPAYVCQLCGPDPADPTALPPRYTLAGVTAHLATVHEAAAIPTPGQEQLLALRTEADQRQAAQAAAEAAAAEAAAAAAVLTEHVPSTEEAPDARSDVQKA